MSTSIISSGSVDALAISRKSWVAFLGPLLACAIILLVAVPLVAKIVSLRVGIVCGVLVVAYFAYQILVMWSVRLYIDDLGVWVYEGILPWNRGVSGVKWRDLDEAVYLPGFAAWVTGAYDLKIAHRYTKSSEIVLSSMSRGNLAAEVINGRAASRAACTGNECC
jgi:hypothetical protein